MVEHNEYRGNFEEAELPREQRLTMLVEATTVLLSDQPTKPVDAVFFHGRSFFDAEKRGIFTIVADLIKQDRAKYVLLCDSEGEQKGKSTPKVAFAGKSLWTDRLVRLGVPQDKIIYAPHPIQGEHGFSTKDENDAFVNVCIENDWKSAVIVTQPHQIVRAMLGTVRTINQKGCDLDVWNISPQSTNWQRPVRGSQGMELKPRMDHIEDEIKRVFAYQDKGDLASFDELYYYLWERKHGVVRSRSFADFLLPE